MAGIVTVTPNPSVDISFGVERLVDTVKLRCGQSRKDAGGGGINVARVLHRLDGDCLAVYLAGGATGAHLDALLDVEQVPRARIETEGETRENVTVLEASTRREFRFVLPGPQVAEDEWRRCLHCLETLDPLPRFVVASGSLPPGVPRDFYARIARWARAHDVRMALDAAGDVLGAALDEGVFLVKPSLDELSELIGAPLATPQQWRAAARQLVQQGKARCVALSLGARGALLATKDGVLGLPALPVKVVSAVGAGDSFLAAMIWAFDHEANTTQALRYAIAAGSAAVASAGTALCAAGDIARLYREACALAPVADIG